jgi:hypothetical protein
VVLAAWILVGSSLSLAAEDSPPPDFDLEFGAPEHVGGPLGALVAFEADVWLESTPLDDRVDRGAQGWSLSVAVGESARILGVSLDGTAGDSPPRGYFTDGFRIAQLTQGPGNDGAVSAVALFFTQSAALPIRGRFRLLRIDCEVEVGERDSPCKEVSLEFQDGLQGTGLPVRNTLTHRGQTRRDDGSALDLDSDGVGPTVLRVCPDPEFQRADCDSNGRRDITDPIALLYWLFLGGSRPQCLLACDSNDDDSTDITDAVYTLNWLFLGGEPPPAPFPECGKDPTDGTLSCGGSSC